VEPAPPLATLRLDPLGDQPPDSLSLGQPFHVRVTVPADWQPGPTVSITVTAGDKQETLVLTPIDASAGVLTFSTPGPVSIGGVLAGPSDPSSRFAVTTSGTIMLSGPPNGGPVAISLAGFRGPDTGVSVTVPLFDNAVDQNIWRVERALTVLEAITKQQQADASWVLSQPDLPDDVRVEAQALANTAERNTIVLGQARSSMAGAGTRLGTLIAGGEYLTLIVRGPGNLEWGTALENVQRRIVESTNRQDIVRDNIVNYSTSTTYGLYELTRVLTLAGPAYEAGQLAINPALRNLNRLGLTGYDVGPAQSSWGRPITTEEQVFALVELVLAIGLMVGLPRLVDYLAGRSLRASMNQAPPLPRSQQFARAPGSNPTATQPLPRTGTTPGMRTGPGDTQPLLPRTPPPPIPTTDPAAAGVRGGDTAAGNLRRPQASGGDPLAPPPPEAASSPTLRGGETPTLGNNRASTPEASESPTLRGGEPTAAGTPRAAAPGAPPATPPARVSPAARAASELEGAVANARKFEVSEEVIGLIWQNSPSVREAVTRLNGAATLRKLDVGNDLIADALRMNRTQAEVDEFYALLFDAGEIGVLNPTLRSIFNNAGSREQIIFGVRRQIGLAAADGMRVEVVRSRDVKTALVEAEKLAKEAGLDLSTIGGGISPEARLDQIVRALLVRRGYTLDVDPASAEVTRIQEISVRTFAKDPQRPDSGGGRMSDEDVVWLTDRLAEDPFYFNNLPTRGRYSNGEFIPILDVRSAVRLRAAYRDATGGTNFGNYDPIGSLDSIRPPAGGRPVEGQPGSAPGGSNASPPGAPPKSPRQAGDWRAVLETAPTNVGPSPATTPTATPVPLPGTASSQAVGSSTDSANVRVARGEQYIAQLVADRDRLRQEIKEYAANFDERRRLSGELMEVEDALRRARNMQALTLWMQEQDRKRATVSAPAAGASPAPNAPPPRAMPEPPTPPPPASTSRGPAPTPSTNVNYRDANYGGYSWRRSDDRPWTVRVGARFEDGTDNRLPGIDQLAAWFIITGGLLSEESREQILDRDPAFKAAVEAAQQNFVTAMQVAALGQSAKADDNPQTQSTLTWADDQPIVVAANEPVAPSRWARDGLWALVRDARGLTRVAGPYASREFGGRERWIAPSGLARQTAGSQAQSERPGVKLFFTSLGRSSGESVRMTVVNDGNVPARIALGAVVLEPVEKWTERDVQRELKKLSGRSQVTVNVEAYCLDFGKPPPAAGMVMRLADASKQAKVAPLARIGEAARRLYEKGALNREADSKKYVQNVLQWVIWTQEQRFDEQGFRRAFVEHAQKNIAGAGRKWTRELEQAVTAMTPQRWADIQAILREAGTIQR
jgi:hypothetical protein